MARITVNPEAEASAAFDVARPGVYRLRIEGSTNFPATQEYVSKAGNTCLKVRLVFADPTGVMKVNGEPAKVLGSIIDGSLVIAPREKQGKLRAFVESAGIAWLDFNTEDLVGRELQAKVDVDEYNGEQKNVVARYLKP